MPIISTELPTYCFLEDIPDVKFSEIMVSYADITVTFNNTPLLDGVKMVPDAKGEIIIFAKQVIRNMITLAKPNSVNKLLPQLIVSLSVPNWGLLSTSSYVIPGCTSGRRIITQEWFSQNFLTWQSSIIETTPTQPQWLAFIPVAPYAQYEIQSTLYAKDGRTFTKTLCLIPQKSNYQQIQVDYSHIWKEYCSSQKIEPYCYDVFGRAWRKTPNSTINASPGQVSDEIISLVTKNKPFAQRYLLRPERFNDVCFGFENTLGGFDTLILEGKQVYLPEGDTTTFKTYTTEKELINGYTSIWEANTGRLETQRTAIQFQDFLKSTNRYVLQEGTWRRIIVTEYKIKDYRGESNSYTFKYHLADKNEGRYYEREELPEVDLPYVF